MVFAEDVVDDVRAQLRELDGVLVWVDPIMRGFNRTRLDALRKWRVEGGVAQCGDRRGRRLRRTGAGVARGTWERAGFGHQYVLLDPPASTRETPPAPPRLYYGPKKPEFQELKRRIESGWVQEMLATFRLARDDLPALWDADFPYGPRDSRGEDSYVLCEINVSSVYPSPEEALDSPAKHVARRLREGVAQR